MAPYILCFFLTGICAYINEKSIVKGKSKKNILISGATTILIPSIFAALRDYSVGTDTIAIRKIFEITQNINSVRELIFLCQNDIFLKKVDIGYNFLSYLISKLFNDYHFMLFLISFLNGLLVYFSLYIMKNSCSIFLGEIIYLFTQYNASFNMFRQSIAMSFCLFAVAIVLSNIKKKYVVSLLIIVIASIIHSSAIIGCILIIPYWYFEKKSTTTVKLIKDFFFLLIVYGGLLTLPSIVIYMINHNFLDNRYLHYFTEGNMENGFSYIGMIINFLPCLIFIIGKPLIKKNKRYFSSIVIMYIAFFSLTKVSFYLYRVSTYFLFIQIIILSQVDLYRAKKERKAIIPIQHGLYVGLLISIFIYFVYFIGYCNSHETLPYIFMKQ